MGSCRVNPHRVKIHRNYTTRELADRLGVHKNTVKNWQRHGLAPIDEQRPLLFQGGIVRSFLVSWNKRRKRPCPIGTLYCFRCREARRPAPFSVEYIPRTSGPGNLRAICGECGTVMHRRTQQAAIHAVLPGLLVQITEAQPRLSENEDPPSNCALKAEGVK